MRLQAAEAEFDRFRSTAEVFWRNNVLPNDDADTWILVEALHQDIRVSLRNLTVANALRRVFPAKLAVFTGTDEDWYAALWSDFDVSRVRELAEAYGADAVIDVHGLIDKRVAAGVDVPPTFQVGDREVAVGTAPSRIDPGQLDHIVRATACRVLRVPRLSDADLDGEAYARVRSRSAEFSRVYDAIVHTLRPAALVTSHVDYNHWGLAVESAMRLDVPVLHVQSTGSLKAYALFPEHATADRSFRACLTTLIGDYFDKHVWDNRELIRRSAELVAWRAKGNLGRPSWWRAGSSASMDLGNAVERAQLRLHGVDRLGFDRDKPVVAVFNHAVSDALNTNVETFDDLAGWFEETAAYARTRTDANWLFLDHPSQALYDVSGFFEGIAERYAGARHMVFRPSRALSKNMLWSMADLGVTVRGSVSNELPAYGIPAIQAGWSEWSACGLSNVAADQADYWRLLDTALRGLVRGERLVTDEQVERARLWHWFYRAGNDVASPVVPHWDVGAGDQLLRVVRVAMTGMETDGDPVFAATRRMWERREPFLTRLDLTELEAGQL
ncbi:MAG: hypothetical protein J2P24_03415 [Streptosporangiales bacterium]|nr:hypothetical protein [Streptosporangiales bacterium]MBO0891287.1 hypothetical protein [Acidothermales bacterium]